MALPGVSNLEELSPRTRRVTLSIQERLDSLLAEDGPEQVSSAGRAIPVAQYFIDPWVVTALIFMAWPETGTRDATPELARALGEEACWRQPDHAESAVPGKQASATKSYSDPPATPLVAARWPTVSSAPRTRPLPRQHSDRWPTRLDAEPGGAPRGRRREPRTPWRIPW
ncbi:hypothetical protein ACFC1R_34480 [Kitasatospora sp. NPDC056138]|uniref:hypothetical protein n=1 Tax=Kitasatospora sp. NPDC056138 TaxID=3345724 RepID=UPI0035DC00F3